MKPWINAARSDQYVLIFILIASAVLALQPLSSLVTGMVIDDALYYPKIALNLADGAGFTYDGQTDTNGVHPLWQIVWIPLAFIADGDSNLLLRLGFLISAVIMATGFFVLSRVLRRLGVGPVISAFVLVTLFFARADLFMSLMESVLTFLMIGLALLVSLRSPVSSLNIRRNQVILGLTLGAMFLSRLDTVFIVPGLALATAYTWGARSPRAWISHQMSTGIAFVVVVAPYLIWNVVKFGNVVPVSGIRKMRTTETSLDSIFGHSALLALPNATIGKLPGLEAGWWLIGFVGTVVLAVAFARSYRHPIGPKPIKVGTGVILAGFAAAVIIRYIYLGVMLPGEVVPWYLVPDYIVYSLLLAIGLTAAVRFIPTRLGWLSVAIIPVLALLIIAGSLNIRRDANIVRAENSILYDSGLWAQQNLPADTTVAMYDSGYFSYFSKLDTIPLNGLATDFDTMTQLVDGDRSGVIQRLGVDYLVVLLPASSESDIPKNKVVYASSTFSPGSSYPGSKLFIIGPIDDEVIQWMG